MKTLITAHSLRGFFSNIKADPFLFILNVNLSSVGSDRRSVEYRHRNGH